MREDATSPLAAARRRYAETIAGAYGPALVRAFAAVAREAHLPPPPWTLLRDGAPLVTDDPAALYQDALVTIDAARGINNGQPSLHAMWLGAIAPAPGERVVHVGCGGGYYTAVLAELVGPGGHVTAYEVEADIADLARRSLADRPQVAVVTGSGAEADEAADVVYVNASAPAPARAWVEALRPGGRLAFPWRFGPQGELALLVRRVGDEHVVQALGAVRFIGLQGAPASGEAVDARDAVAATALILTRDRAPDARCVVDFGWSWLSR